MNDIQLKSDSAQQAQNIHSTESAFRLDARVAIVTGGGGGIGGSISRIFASVGAHVACLDISEEAARANAKTIEAAGGRAIGLGCDVGSEEAIAAAVAAVNAQLGKAGILVNCAATLDRSGNILEIDLEEWEKVHRVNLTGAFMMSRAVLPGMIEASKGSIIHIGSRLAKTAWPGRTSYSSTKAALLQFARSMAIDHGAQGIRVNALSPGPIETQRVAYRFRDYTPEERQKQFANCPTGRFGTPDEIGMAALFLASDASSYVTGTELLVDGGCSARAS